MDIKWQQIKKYEFINEAQLEVLVHRLHTHPVDKELLKCRHIGNMRALIGKKQRVQLCGNRVQTSLLWRFASRFRERMQIILDSVYLIHFKSTLTQPTNQRHSPYHHSTTAVHSPSQHT